MKKLLILFTAFLLLFSAFALYASAEGVSTVSENTHSDKLSSLSIYSYPTKTVYGAFERLDMTGLKLRAVYEDGYEELIEGDRIGIRYQQDVYFRVGDSTVMLLFGDKSVQMPVTVNRVAYDLSALDLDDYSVCYNGNQQGYSKPIPAIVGLDGIPLMITASGGGTGVGSYDVSIDFETVSRDYILPETRVITMQITPATAEIVWGDVSFVYDGKSKIPTAYYLDVNGNRIYPKVIGAAINAGGGYTARVIADDSNYSFTNTEINYEIKKADYDFSGVIWSNDSFVYDGSIKSISASGLPLGVSIIGYSSDRGIDAGTYTVTATLRWDETNYNTPSPLTHTWEIMQAEYDISKIKFNPASYVYDGAIHYPELDGVMPIGKDGIALEYSFSAGACHVNDGAVSVIISFNTDSPNYKTPSPIYSSVSITPLAIDVVWGNSSLVYTGESIAPSASSDKCTIRVQGGAISVGSYVAEAVTDNSDYRINNNKISFTIRKAENRWVEIPTSSICFEGKEIRLEAESRFGNVKYRFYSDAECKNLISAPSACGVYYAVAYVEETVNYTGLEYSGISFEIVKIEPVSFYAEITRQGIKAYQTLSPSDLNCVVVNNDGSRVSVDPSGVQVLYENGSSFRKRDTTVTLKYDKFSLTVSVSVDYADYDLSGVSWQGASVVYDGAPKSPWLSGLPSGVSATEYVGAGQINAGNYTVYAIVSYDSENYNEPRIPACSFVIEKCMVATPYITSIYNGRVQIPISDSPLYSIEYNGEFVDAGVYYILAKLYDSCNYCFFDGGSRYLGIFEIKPKTLSVTVFTIKKYLFEDIGTAEYVITDGEVYSRDILTVAQFTENNSVYLRSENSNYILSVTPGKIQRLPYATREGSIKILVLLILVTLAITVVIYMYRKRHNIAEKIEILRCRWINRNITVRPLTAEAVAASRRKTRVVKESEQTYEFDDKNDNIEWNEETMDFDIDEGVEEAEPASAPYDSPMFSVDVERADSLITDSLAKNLLKKDNDVILTDGYAKEIVNVDTLSEVFESGERIDVNSLKEKGLISEDTLYIKVLARGSVDKALTVYANDFSLTAVKMIALTGGEAIKVITQKRKNI